MRSTTAIVLAAILVLLSAATALGYEVVSGHPRLYFRAGDVPELRARCSGAYSSDYNRLKSWCDQNMNASLPVNLEFHLPTYSFVYLMSQDTRYSDRAKEIVQHVRDTGRQNSREFIRNGGLFFDWCYDAMTPAERLLFGETLAEGGAWWLSGDGIGTRWWLTNDYHSKIGRIADLVYPGMALHGEGIDDQLATACIDTYRVHMQGPSHIFCMLQETSGDGSFYEGSYTHTILCTQNRNGMDVWRSGTDETPFQMSNNYMNMSRFLVHETGPKRGWGFVGSKQGDTHGHGAGGSNFRFALYDLAAIYRDGVAQWMADEIDRQDGGYISTYDLWRYIIWRDPTVEQVHPSTVYGETSAARFDSVGYVHMRSGWDISDQSNDIYAVFRCERMPTYHTHAHQGHFMIARGGDILAIDSGNYDSWGSSHHRNYFTRTVAHNTITVFDPSETTWGSRSNDGGQVAPWNFEDDRPIRCGDASLPMYDRGRLIVPGNETDDYVYMKGDMTAAYSSSKVSLCTREFVWLKPDYFVVLDRVRATSPSFPTRWLLHSLNEPAVSGNTSVVSEGGSKLFIETVLPTQHRIDKIGGSGHEFEVNGVNYPRSGDEGGGGAWRIEVEATSNENEHIFLHVMHAGPSSMTAMPEVTYIDSDEYFGVNVAGRTVLFTKSGVSDGGEGCWVTGE